MARHLILTQEQPTTLFHAAFAAMTLLLLGFTMFMCASHSRRLRQLKACLELDDEHDPVIELNNEMMMVMNNGGGVNETSGADDPSIIFSGEQQGGVPVWQKNILMGGKCQLPEFSGVIIYDSEGNVVAPSKNAKSLLPWK